MIRPLVVLFLLGALQGAVGWIMVASGLTGDAIYVKPTKLAAHFVLACILISYAFWFGLQLLIKNECLVNASRGYKNITRTIIFLLFIQLAFGALMAGHKAAPVAPTWPDINGSLIPAYVFNRPEGYISTIEDPIVIQFIHRSMAYILFILLVLWSVKAFRIPSSAIFKKARVFPLIFVFIQICLGIFTVLTSNLIKATKWNIFEWLAQLHQLVAIFLLLSLTAALYLLQTKQNANSKLGIDPQRI
jgi:cytochrome c oxidase assembly protein subunit 15